MGVTHQQDVIEGFYTLVSESIGEDIGNRVFELTAQQNSELPLCVFFVISDIPNPTMGGALGKDHLNMFMQVDLYGWRKDGARALRDIDNKLYNELNRNSLVDNNSFTNLEVYCTERGILSIDDKNKYRIRSEWKIFGSDRGQIS